MRERTTHANAAPQQLVRVKFMAYSEQNERVKQQFDICCVSTTVQNCKKRYAWKIVEVMFVTS